jgi:KDO2-lipid IV(A) lauroyltransferase
VANAPAKTWRDFLAPRHWPTWLGLALLRLWSLLPMPVLAPFGWALGLVVYAAHAGRRHVVRTNIAACFPELSRTQQARLVRAHYRAFGQTVVTGGITLWAGERRLRRLVRVRSHEHYERALRAGQNIILLAPHFLGLDLGGLRLACERRMLSVYRHPDNTLLAFVVERARSRYGGYLVEHNKPFLSLVRQVRQGLPLYYLPDQDAGRRRAVFAPFFGIAASTFAAVPRLAELTQAVVMVCYTRLLPWGRGAEVIFRPPLANYPSGDPVADAARMNSEIEECVQQAPEQYFWLHKRFKTRPEGEPDFYRRR